VISDVSQLRSIAALVLDENNAYDDLCTNTAGGSYSDELKALTDDITKQGRTLTCYASGDKYCISVDLSTGQYFCADSTGVADKYDTNGCDGANYTCAAD